VPACRCADRKWPPAAASRIAPAGAHGGHEPALLSENRSEAAREAAGAGSGTGITLCDSAVEQHPPSHHRRRPASATVCSVANPSIPIVDAAAQASDSLQAAYFRGALADLRATITAAIARQNGKLATMSTKINPLAVSRLRREIRENEEECQQLDHMIEAIDRRFSSQWASRL
jgi:hypothetical protein